jgi:ComF family protein
LKLIHASSDRSRCFARDWFVNALMNLLKHRLRSIVDFVLTAKCPLCQRSGTPEFCLDCQRQVQRCRLSIAEQSTYSSDTIFAWGHYGGALKRSLTTLKYDHHPELARPLAHWLADAWLAQPSVPRLTVVPIPIHATKRQQRKFNQADLLAQHFCDRVRLPLALHGLDRSRETEAQFKLSSYEREQNLANAFCLGKSFLKRRPPNSVLLLDDIYTTGATARSAAQILRRHGISVYGIAVVARTQLSH